MAFAAVTRPLPSGSAVSTAWLAAHRHDPHLRLVDASFKLPGVTPTAPADYAREHIPGAVFFDIDRIAAPDTAPLPHMLPTADAFAREVGLLGIGDDDLVVLYDSAGLAGPARVWWSFRVFGHDRVVILEGGLKLWKAQGRPVDSALPTPAPARFTARFRPELVRDRAWMLANLATRAAQVIDARSAGRFDGSAPEFWPGRRRGHIPGSLNLDYAGLIEPETGALRGEDEIRARFAAAGYDPSRPVVTSCGSGITACVLALALQRAGLGEAAIYDGSWAEWGLPGPLPIETGPPAPV
jgi:thiosulfate/3-mercaptopyruvate sulfurtransferase